MTTDKTPATLAVDVLAVMDRAQLACEANTSRTVYVGGEEGFKRISDDYGLPEARAAVAELIEALTLARSELSGLPHSLGYSFTHLPKIDAVLDRVKGESA